MTERTIRTTVSFRQPFTLRSVGAALPSGTYTIETIEELIEGVSFPAHRRVVTTLFLPAGSAGADVRQFATVDPVELAEALRRDEVGGRL